MYYNYYYRKKSSTSCPYCGKKTDNKGLCDECLILAEDETIKLNENKKWVKNPVKGNEYKFYDPNKKYFIKEKPLTDEEMKFFNLSRMIIKEKFYVTPQINLQTIIETNTYTRNDELFRNIDFGIFNAISLKPILMIELNGQQHYNDEYWKERDKSVINILKDAQIPLLTIETKTIKQFTDKEILKIIKTINKQINNKKGIQLEKINKQIEKIKEKKQ